MSKRQKIPQVPLRNITASFNSTNMSYSSESGFPNLTNSPMSNLTFNLSELSTGRTTPRRRLSLSSTDTPPNENGTPTTERTMSAESGFCSDSPLVDSPTFDNLNIKRFTTALHPDIPLEAFSVKKKTIAYRRISSQPLPTLRLDSPTDFLDEDKDEENEEKESQIFTFEATSQDSGLGMEHERKCHSMSSFDDLAASSSLDASPSRLPTLDEMWNTDSDFKAPRGKPPKRQRSSLEDRVFSEDTCSPTKYSPVKTGLPKPSFSLTMFSEDHSQSVNIPKSKTAVVSSSVDDGFQELFEVEDVQNEADGQISTLISATLLHQPLGEKEEEASNVKTSKEEFCVKRVKFQVSEKDVTPSSRPVNCRLQRSKSVDLRPRQIFKRSDPPQDLHHPTQRKRWRGDDDFALPSVNKSQDDHSKDSDEVKTVIHPQRLHRCHSETEAMIKSAVSRMAMEPDLIGDCSKPYCLPIINGKHQDLKSISAETVNGLLCDEFSDIVETYHIVDCRYPYEYKGGHIKNALNLYTKENIIEQYLKSPLRVKDPSKRIILIFHCEFSSERGPGLSRFLRRHDRESNKECYPFLHYPELYLLDGGYKNFYEKFENMCEPRRYLQMVDKNHSEDMRKFRAKAKSWAGEKTNSRTGMRNLKF